MAPPCSRQSGPAPPTPLLLLGSALLRATPAFAGVRPPCQPLDPSNPCLIECPGPPGGDEPIYRFDLSSFLPKGQNKWIVASSSFYMMPCQALTTVTCGNQVRSAAIQYWGALSPPHFDDSCAALGKYPVSGYNNCTLTSAPPNTNGIGLVCGFVGGDPIGSAPRSVDVNYVCSKTPANPTASQGDSDSPHYTVTLTGPHACAFEWKKPLSLGWVLIICIFVLVIVYVAAGCTYNVKMKKKAVGLGAVPQIEYWKMLPGLVKDGCKYSWTAAKKGYYAQVHGKAPPLDNSLTTRLADDQEPIDRT